MRKIIIIIAILLVGAVFVFSGYKVVSYYLDASKTNAVTQELADKVIQHVDPSTVIPAPPQPTKPSEAEQETTEPIEETEEPTENVLDEYPAIRVDFDALRQQNSDVIGWLYSEDTQINYPIMISSDNLYYLYRMINRKYNVAGSLFADYRSKTDFSDWNTVIFGHNRYSGAMFGSLPKYTSQAYYDAHPYMYLLTPAASYKVELIACFVTPAEGPIYNVSTSEADRDEILQNALEHSYFHTDAELKPYDRYITLSTCTYNNKDARYVVIGRLWRLNDLP